VHTSTRARAIVSAMVRLATALDAAVVAEGVELPEQRQTLSDLGCLSGQGFLWSPALPMEQLRPWLAARTLHYPLVS
jgi:EAL domain-containing protein (putative c-di-GMP-specific phosphodiesterase class I)